MSTTDATPSAEPLHSFILDSLNERMTCAPERAERWALRNTLLALVFLRSLVFLAAALVCCSTLPAAINAMIAEDSDGDGLPDAWEFEHFGDLTHDGRADGDADRLTDANEYGLGSDPRVQDTDGDGVWDGEEWLGEGTDPLVADTDGDGLNDGLELAARTNGNSEDSDGDGLPDRFESNTPGYDPLVFTPLAPLMKVRYAFDRFGVLFREDFEGLDLQSNFEEPLPGDAVWTHGHARGWVVERSGIPGLHEFGVGVTEWKGWCYADRAWWTAAAGDERRSEFVRGSGTVAVADPDEWNDLGNPSSLGTFNSFLVTPTFPVGAYAGETVQLSFDSSFRPSGNQRATVTVSFEDGDDILLIDWTDTGDNKTNEHIVVPFVIPNGASNMWLSWGLTNAGDDWWWAIDNIQVTWGDPSMVENLGVAGDGVLRNGDNTVWAPADSIDDSGYLNFSEDGAGSTAMHVDTGLPMSEVREHYTMMAWVRFAHDSGDNMIFGQAVDEDVLHNGGRDMSFHQGHWNNDQSAGTIFVDHWHHVAFVYSAGVQTLIVDGQTRSATANQGPVPSNANIVIGTTRSEEDRDFAGSLDDVRIYSAPLTAAKVRDISGLEPGVDSLVLSYQFEDGVGRVISNDVHGTDGTLHGAEAREELIAAFGSGSPSRSGPGALVLRGAHADGAVYLDTNLTAVEAGLHGATDYTVMAWVKADSIAGNSTVIGQLGTPDRALRFGIRNGSYHLAHGDNDLTGLSEHRVEAGVWHHVAWRYFQGVQSIVLDGGGLVESPREALKDDSNLLVGIARPDSAFKGMLDDIRIYNKFLQASDIAFLSGHVDNDADQLPDAWEKAYFGNLDPSAFDDNDNDGLVNAQEQLLQTNPSLADSDGDGLTDGVEEDLRTSATRPDSDRDGLDDGQEVHVTLTDPLIADSDDDGFADGAEIDSGTDPLDPLEAPASFTVQMAQYSTAAGSIDEWEARFNGGEEPINASVTENHPNLNFHSDVDGRFGGNQPFPLFRGIGENENCFMRAAGKISIVEAGLRSFGVHASGTFRVRIDGVVAAQTLAPAESADTFFAVELGAGTHEVELTFFANGDKSHFEFFVANTTGEFAVWDPSIFGLVRANENNPLLVAYYPLDAATGQGGGLVTPDVVNSHDMVMVNLTEAHVVPGIAGNAFRFSNAEQTMLEFLSDGNFDLPLNQDNTFSISLWTKIHGPGQNDLRIFSEASTQRDLPLFAIGTKTDGADGSVDFFSQGYIFGEEQSSTTEALDNTWRHLAWVQNGTITALYIDGVLDATIFRTLKPSLMFSAPNVLNTTAIGGIRREAASHWVSGLIDDVSLWKGALTQADVQALAAGASPEDVANGTAGRTLNWTEGPDSDGDGIGDASEALAGTNPLDRNDFFQITAIEAKSGKPKLELRTVPGRSYQIEFSESLETGSWQVIDEIPGDGSIHHVADPSAGWIGLRQGFYRARVTKRFGGRNRPAEIPGR